MTIEKKNNKQTNKKYQKQTKPQTRIKGKKTQTIRPKQNKATNCDLAKR